MWYWPWTIGYKFLKISKRLSSKDTEFNAANAEYDVKIIYIAGKYMFTADVLSQSYIPNSRTDVKSSTL